MVAENQATCDSTLPPRLQGKELLPLHQVLPGSFSCQQPSLKIWCGLKEAL